MTDINTQFSNSKLDRYEIKEKVGTGGMARVYRGYDTNLQRQVAIKILHDHLNDDPTFKERFQREARFVAGFNHPNIVRIYDYNTVERGGGEVSYMIMSYLPGESLQAIIDRLITMGETLPQNEVLKIMRDLAKALDYAHMQGMVHRDVKPANILFDEHKHAILTDFGIARMAENSKLTQEGTTVGTPAYMSPEQATGQPIDARSDLYALAIILYELLTGRPPFDDDGSISVLLKHVNEPPPPISKYSTIDDPYLDAVVCRALAKDPRDRYQSAQAFIEDLERALNHEEPEALQKQPSFNGNGAKLDDAKTAVITTPITNQKTTDTLTQAVVRKFQQSPLAILTIGLTIIILILLIGLLQNGEDDNVNANNDNMDVLAADEGDSDVSSMTGAMPMYFENDFTTDDNLADNWPQDSNLAGLNRQIIREDSIYRIENQRSGRAVATIFDTDNQYTDFTIEFSGELDENSSGVSGYGIIFRYQDERNYNVFAIDGEGRYSIWLLDNGNWRELRQISEEWTTDEAVNPIGENNILRLEVRDNQIVGYVNGTFVVDLEHDTIESGGIGIYLAAPPDGSAIVEVDLYAVMEPSEDVDSMTGTDTTSMTGSRYADLAMTQAATNTEDDAETTITPEP